MIGSLKNKKIAVLMGGPGSEREVSLRSGEAVARALQSCGAITVALDITGTDFTLPAGTDLAFNMIHGTFGEDGQLQGILEARDMPYTGENAECSRIAFDKILTKEKFDAAGVPTAEWKKLHVGDKAPFEVPYVVKAPRQGSSVGVHIIKDGKDFDAAMKDCLQFGDEVLVEKFVKGRELTVGVVDGKALPIVEIRPNEGFYDYQHKYTKGASEYFVPAPIGDEATALVQKTAIDACRALGLKIYSRVDILLTPDGAASVLEINTIPGMTETSLLPKAAAEAGIDFPSLCERIAELSLNR